MDLNLVYAKTPLGDEAVRQSTRVVQRNLRMVLLQVDGSLSVEELAAKIGNQRLVEGALKELEAGGFIVVATAAQITRLGTRQQAGADHVSALSQFSTFGPKSVAPASVPDSRAVSGNYSSFGRPVLPSSTSEAVMPEPSPRAASPAPPAGRRISSLKWAGGGLALLLLALVGLVVFFPYGNFKPAIEQTLSRLLAAPVKVGDVRFVLFPQPRLALSDVVIGVAADSRIASVTIASPYTLLGKAPFRIPEVELSGVTLTANRLVDLPMFGADAMASGDLVIGRLEISQATVSLGDLQLPEFSGEILLQAGGSAEKATFRALDGSLRLVAAPTAQGVLLSIEGMSWKPAGMPFAFESLQAMGLLQKNRLLLQKVDTTFLGGLLKGNWLLDWSSGMVMAGEASLARLDCRKVSAAFVPALNLEGDLSGSLRMRATGASWQDMLSRIEGNLDAEIARGMLHGLDLGEVARQGSGSLIRSGATRFDTLLAHLDVGNGRVAVRGIQLDAGLMTASGRASVDADGRVDGSLVVRIRTSVSSLRVPARLSGTLGDMSLQGGS